MVVKMIDSEGHSIGFGGKGGGRGGVSLWRYLTEDPSLDEDLLVE